MLSLDCHFCHTPLAQEPTLHGCNEHSYHHYCYNQWLQDHPDNVCPLCDHDVVQLHPEGDGLVDPLNMIHAVMQVAMYVLNHLEHPAMPAPVLDPAEQVIAASNHNNLDRVQELLANGVVLSVEQRVMVCLASIVHGNAEMFNFVFHGHHEELGALNIEHLILTAASHDRLEIVQQLMQDYDDLTLETRVQAIYVAIENRNLEMFNRFFLGHEDTVTPEIRGRAITLAAENNFSEFVELLIEGDPEIPNADRVHALESASFFDNLTVFNLLYHGHEDVPSAHEKGRLLVIAVTSNCRPIIDRLAQDHRPIGLAQRLHALIIALSHSHLDLIDVIQNINVVL